MACKRGDIVVLQSLWDIENDSSMACKGGDIVVLQSLWDIVTDKMHSNEMVRNAQCNSYFINEACKYATNRLHNVIV